MADQNLLVKILIDAQDRASSVFAGIKNSITSMAGAAVGALGSLAAGAFLKGAVSDAQALDVQMRKLEQVIRATGGAAGVTAADINKMFAQEGNAAEFRDAAAQLLTFKSVSKDVFEETLRLAEDLSEAGFGGLSENAVRLGKALEDPVAGLGALRRVGVTFTEDQQNLIKSLVETGDKAAAQAVILEAVAGQVGGVAAAMEGGFAGAAEKIEASFRQIRENLGSALLPTLTVAAEYLGNLSARWVGVAGATDEAGNATRGFSATAIALAEGVGNAVLFVDRLGRGVGALAAKLAAIATGDFGAVGAIDKAFNEDNARAVEEFNQRLDELKKPREVEVKAAADTQSIENVEQALDSVGAKADEVRDKISAVTSGINVGDTGAGNENGSPQAPQSQAFDDILAKIETIKQPIPLTFEFVNLADTLAQFDTLLAKISQVYAAGNQAASVAAGATSTEQTLSNEALKFGSVTE